MSWMNLQAPMIKQTTCRSSPANGRVEKFLKMVRAGMTYINISKELDLLQAESGGRQQSKARCRADIILATLAHVGG